MEHSWQKKRHYNSRFRLEYLPQGNRLKTGYKKTPDAFAFGVLLLS